jgi:hypothetical protein
MLRVHDSFGELQYLIYLLYYSNLIELKNKESFKDLEKLYTSSFLIDYSTKINIKERGKHAFNFAEYQNFYDEMCEGFIKGIIPPSLTNGITTLDYSIGARRRLLEGSQTSWPHNWTYLFWWKN